MRWYNIAYSLQKMELYPILVILDLKYQTQRHHMYNCNLATKHYAAIPYYN